MVPSSQLCIMAVASRLFEAISLAQSSKEAMSQCCLHTCWPIKHKGLLQRRRAEVEGALPKHATSEKQEVLKCRWHAYVPKPRYPWELGSHVPMLAIEMMGTGGKSLSAVGSISKIRLEREFPMDIIEKLRKFSPGKNTEKYYTKTPHKKLTQKYYKNITQKYMRIMHMNQFALPYGKIRMLQTAIYHA